MKKAVRSLLLLMSSLPALASGHGPVFGFATPTNSQGEWSVDFGLLGRGAASDTQLTSRLMLGYGITPHVTVSFTAPVVFHDATLPISRIGSGDDFEANLAWRFQHRATKVGTRIESTMFGGLVVPGPQQGDGLFSNLARAPGVMGGVTAGMASRSHYIWVGGAYTHFAERNGDRRPGVFAYSLVYGYRPPKWRKEADHWDWRFFGELTGERSNRILAGNAAVSETQAHQLFVGPSFLGIKRDYAVEFGVQFPVYQHVGSRFPEERVRFAINFSKFLFQHGQDKH